MPGLGRRKKIPAPLDLFFMLIDSCMHRLSPNAWKLVCYVAAQHLRVHPEWLDRFEDPIMAALHRDLAQVGIMGAAGPPAERSYRLVPDGPYLPGEATSRFVVISLRDFCKGLRLRRRRRDFGTGLSKSSLAAAIKEAVRSGIVVQRRNKSGAGRDLASLYAIDWDLVQQLDWARRKNRKIIVRA